MKQVIEYTRLNVCVTCVCMRACHGVCVCVCARFGGRGGVCV